MLAHFDQWRLIVKSGDTVEVAHESMFREWPRFTQWLVPEKSRLEALRGLESAAAVWSAKGRRSDDLIHRGRRLAEAGALLRVGDYKRQIAENTEASKYLAACRAAQQRRRIYVGAVVLVFLAPFLVYEGRIAAAQIKLRRAVKAAETYRPTALILRGEEVGNLQNFAAFRDCADCPEMVVLPAGKFSMGSSDDEPHHTRNESPVHTVAIRRFAIGRFEVTFDDWAACTMDGGCRGNPKPSDFGSGRGRRPVVDVTWNDARGFAQWLYGRTGQIYRLPSEAELEYAARANTSTPYYTGVTIDQFQANFSQAVGRTEPVGSYPPNGFGLYDMAGNVWEWAEDCWRAGYDVDGPLYGAAWESPGCALRVVRGGSWLSDSERLRSALRLGYGMDFRDDSVGFRVARILN